MPRRFRRKPRTGGRGTRRRFTRKTTTTRRRRHHQRDMPTRIISKQLGGFPERYFCRLKSTGRIGLAAATSQYVTWTGGLLVNQGYSSAGASLVHFPAAGSAYLLGVAGSPATAPYSAYRVWGSSIKLRITTATATLTAQQLDMVLLPSLSAASLPAAGGYGTSNLDTTGGQPFAITRSAVINNTARPTMMKKFMSLRRIFGVKYKAAIEGNIDFQGTTSVDPTPWYWNLHIYGDGATTFAPAVDFEQVFYVEFFERTNLLTIANP